MSEHKNLVFFNKEGDYLNFKYNDGRERFEGDILFHENSTDTFKTFGLYLLEKIPSFEFEVVGELTLDKFQLFNEYGLHLYGASFFNQEVEKIEPINNDANFYSKWVYGVEFDSKFPIGTIILFNQPILEFNNPNKSYVVVSTKKNAIMVIGSIDNANFENMYYQDYTNPQTFNNITISGANTVGVYDYINIPSYKNKLSNWSEPDFYDKYYIGKRLNIVNSYENDGVVTVTNPDITDSVHFEFEVSNIPSGDDLIIEVITRTDLPKIYEGGLNITNDGIIYFLGNVPSILKSGREFKIVGSNLNSNFLNVVSIPNFLGNNQVTFYPIQSQVIWNNKTYECVQSYTQSIVSSITPDDVNYWTSKPTHIKVDQTTISENLLHCQIYLTTDRYYFDYQWTESSNVTLASAAEKYKDDLKLFNIDLFFDQDKLKADLIYPSKYAEVNFYHKQLGNSYSIGDVRETYERMVQVKEVLNYELNYNISDNFRYNIVFTDIDEFGIRITINKMVYQEEVAWIFSGSMIDMERTIDRTLRNWLTRNYSRLHVLGIIPELSYIGNFSSVFYNSIRLRTQYPNVPIELNSVEVGTTADYHIEHSRVLFTDMGGYLSIKINDKIYDQETIFSAAQVANIPETLNRWLLKHNEILTSFGIFITHINNMLKFDIKRLDRRLDYNISVGESFLPGQSAYKIIKRIRGNHGMLITSNEVKLPTTSDFSFTEAGFATGMVFSVNNTIYPFNNQEFNILTLNNDSLNLSYEGPFWGLTDSSCNTSAYVTIAFTLGFGQTGCSPSAVLSDGGPFDLTMFDPGMFSFSNNPNTYTINSYNLSSYPGTTNLVDITYIQLSNSIYAFGDSLVVMDAFLSQYITTIDLIGNVDGICLRFNSINNFLYCLSKNKVFIVDPLLNKVISTINLNDDAFDLAINTINGDIYITYENIAKVDIYNYNNILVSTILTQSPNDTMTGKMAFNQFEADMYVTTNGGTNSAVIRIDGNTRVIQQTYVIGDLKHIIYYEPVNESVYVFSDTQLYKIDNGVIIPIALSSGGFNDIVFNNLSGQMNVSSDSNFYRLDLNDDSYQSSGVANSGYMVVNQFDGDVYLSSQSLNAIVVINAIDGSVKYSEPMTSQTTKCIYNPERKSVWAIQPLNNTIVEVEVKVNSSINILNKKVDKIDGEQYGTLSPDYVQKDNLWLKTREYVRRPREKFEGEVPIQYYFKWFSDNIPQFFMYDFSGEQLATSGSYSYLGPKPLDKISLIRTPNDDFDKVELAEYQQTIFDKIEYRLQYINDVNDISTEPEPIQLFLGFKSTDEGSLRSVLQLYKKEDIKFEITSTQFNNTDVSFETIIDEVTELKYGHVVISSASSQMFTNRGLRIGQHLSIHIKDITNNRNQYTSNNNGIIVKIREIYTKILVVDFFNTDLDFLTNESSVISDYPKVGLTTYLRVNFKVIDKEIGRFITYGQTEEEDIRYKIELSNVGKLIGSNDTFIFKEYDIKEGGVDWIYLNKKRKEMLLMKHLIYPYIGSYKSIINAINFFGYNDLQLNEYYRNINPESENYFKLFKVEIPDIFDNSVDGWVENDFIKHTYPNQYFEETNLLNLTYFITDKEGNNTLHYSLDEVIIKLQGLKYWLKKNIIPLTHKILDITGRAFFKNGSQIQHRLHDISIINMRQRLSPVDFNLTEAYLMPVNSGSTVYNCVLKFGAIGDYLPDYFSIDIRTYKTYKEWAPFVTYNKGDKIIYYGKIYESVIPNNRVKNPRKFENVIKWIPDTEYNISNIVEYERDYYVFKGVGSSAIPPLLDVINWLKITEWKHIDFEPVQKISEYRNIDNLLPFNFTVDSNIDPLVVIEVTCDNGYGAIYRVKKNYEIRGLLDLRDPIKYIDPIGPFKPIPIVTTPISI
jgi:hypothetical protein